MLDLSARTHTTGMDGESADVYVCVCAPGHTPAKWLMTSLAFVYSTRSTCASEGSQPGMGCVCMGCLCDSSGGASVPASGWRVGG